MTSRLALGLFLAGLSASCAPTDVSTMEVSKAPVATGNEFRVNSNTTFGQEQSSVALAEDFVVVWTGSDGSGYGILAQLHHASGAPLGLEFQVNTHTPLSQSHPSVASDKTGSFVVVWTSPLQDGSGYGIFAQRFDARGAARGPELQVNTYTTSNQREPSVAGDTAGNFVVVWTSERQDGSGEGVFAQRYDASGAPRGFEFRVNTYTSGRQSRASVASNAAGSFVVTWQSYGQRGSTNRGWGVFAQRYDASGAPQGTEFQVNTYTDWGQFGSSVALDAAGDFVVAWMSYYRGIFARRYESSGAPREAEFQVNTQRVLYQSSLRVASDAGGSFVVVWDGNRDGSGSSVSAQCYDAAGAARGSEFLVNVYTTGSQHTPSLALDGPGNLIVAWSGAGEGDPRGVFARRIGCDVSTADAVDPGAITRADDNGVLEPGNLWR